eukprot:CAMPEP_0194267732 /NCGR_PEP_ID=MMETSP0169-20130528/2179_1 /TAXON_ID=218684 /ORGANISM="Corethron pennatum, Strain L29A3" /LENGTH=362 /DNA_ID=CAMNT_0039008685 /DNA_START=121 /DNA_END=1209 /DNA_ORIENTATION=+
MKLNAPPLLLLLSSAIEQVKPALAQIPPCPPPGLELIVDTQEKCMCFYSLLGSALDIGDQSTFDAVFTDDTVQEFTQSGTYYGADGIAEYLSYVQSGEEGFVKSYTRIGMPLFLDMTGSTLEQCVATSAERRRLSVNSRFAVDNQEMCIDSVTASTIYYTMTGIPEAPIIVQRINSWLPNEIINYPTFAETEATAEYVCDVLVNSCGMGIRNESKQKTKKSLKGKKRSNPPNQSIEPVYSQKTNKKFKKQKQPERKDIAKCLADFNSLPIDDSNGALNYIDGNSRKCRILHAYFASTNPDHCPHVSFEADEDVNGFVKCNKSKLAPLTDLFSEKELGSFMFAGIHLGLGESGIDVQMKACPA